MWLSVADMSRSRSAGSDGSDNEGDGAAEHEMELQKLQRQYRLLENDRNAYAQESQEMLRKQM
jgi:coiled-coil domain-containing protein 63/114